MASFVNRSRAIQLCNWRAPRSADTRRNTQSRKMPLEKCHAPRALALDSEVNDDYHHYRHEVLRLRLLGQEKLPLRRACHYLDSQIDVELTNIYVAKIVGPSNNTFCCIERPTHLHYFIVI